MNKTINLIGNVKIVLSACLGIASVLITATLFAFNQLNSNDEKRINDCLTRLDKVERFIEQANVNLILVKNDVEWIKRNLEARK